MSSDLTKPDLWLAPYLPLAGSMEVGPWRFVAFNDFDESHAQTPELFEECRQLITAYGVPNAPGRLGAVVLPREGRVGDDLHRSDFTPLRLALVAALIDQNPSPVTDGDDDENPNAGHSVATTENAQLFGQPLDGRNHYVISVGGMTEKLDWRTAPAGEPLPPVEPPVALLTPMMRGTDDGEYLAALYETLRSGDEVATRLARCIRWQGVAWSNEQVVDVDTRILSLRAALEVLFAGDLSTREVGTALSQLLGDHSVPTPRQWRDRGRDKETPLTETEWWFQSFTLLRNAIAHGNDVPAELYGFGDGVAHLWHAEAMLRRAIKRTVIAAGHPRDLELPPSRRALRRAYREFAREQGIARGGAD